MEGRVWSLLVASLVTVWAVFGELVTLAQLVGELGTDQGFNQAAVYVVDVLLATAALVMAIYTWRRLPAIARSTRRGPPPTKRRPRAPNEATAVMLEAKTSSRSTPVSLL